MRITTTFAEGERVPAGSILIADGDSTSREWVSGLLRRAGYDVTVAETGDAALQAAAEKLPALVILEVELPGLSGYDVCRSLREAYGETLPILCVSGKRTEPIDGVAALMIGADDYLVKPLSAAELLARVRRALTRSKGLADASRVRRTA